MLPQVSENVIECGKLLLWTFKFPNGNKRGIIKIQNEKLHQYLLKKEREFKASRYHWLAKKLPETKT